MKNLWMVAFLISFSWVALAQDGADTDASVPNPRVRMDTNLGAIVIELDRRRAPKTVDNFLHYVRSGHYENTIFHRVINGFMAQGGGYTAEFVEKPTAEPVVNESGNGLSNSRGTVGIARIDDPHSAASQFYFNLVDNSFLDPRPTRWGYAVFGKVVSGMNVVDEIGHRQTGRAGPFAGDVPVDPVTIERAVELEDPATQSDP